MANNQNSQGPLAFLATQRIELAPDANHPAVDMSFLDAAKAAPAAHAPAPSPQVPPAEPPRAEPHIRQAPPLPLPAPATQPQPAAQAFFAEQPRPEKAGKGKIWIIGGVAAFGVLLLGILLSGLLRPKPYTAAPNAVFSETPGMAAAETPSLPGVALPEAPAAALRSEPPKGFTEQQMQAVCDDIMRRISEQVTKQTTPAGDDPLFQAALQGAQCGEFTFRDGSIQVTLLLPDAMKLESLQMEPYVPRTDAQAYIRKSYAALLANVGTLKDKLAYTFDVYYEKQSNGEISYDITLPMLSFPLYDYNQIFGPHMDEYMKQLGFYAAAQEVLMPDFQDWDLHKGADKDSPTLGAYFDSLAAALSDKGINVNGKVTVNTAEIRAALETRFKQTWMFEGLEFTHNYGGYFMSFHYPNNFSYFNGVTEKLSAQYKAGAISAPTSPAELEAMFTQERRKETNAMLQDSPNSRTNLMLEDQVQFDWETLGKHGIAACPYLVESIRQFINGYDFHLDFFAGTAGFPDCR
jgi:hypothetical protein